MKSRLRDRQLHTVCESAMCPNRGECFRKGTATFLLLGNRCTRRCGFCSVPTGRPASPDPGEPDRVAAMVREMGLHYAVLTMVTRDDLPDGGAAHVADTVRAIHDLVPDTRIEVLVSDFKGDMTAVDTVLASPIDVFNHNIEMVPSCYAKVRPGTDYPRSLSVLRHAAKHRKVPVKSGFMVGLGETLEEIHALMKDLREAGVSILTIGQYLRPTRDQVPVQQYLSPEAFHELEMEGRRMGFAHVFSGPFVRSSYMAEAVFRTIRHD